MHDDQTEDEIPTLIPGVSRPRWREIECEESSEFGDPGLDLLAWAPRPQGGFRPGTGRGQSTLRTFGCSRFAHENPTVFPCCRPPALAFELQIKRA